MSKSNPIVIDEEYPSVYEDEKTLLNKLGANPTNTKQISKIENLELEALVVEWIIQDVSPTSITRRLNEMYPGEGFTTGDITKFINIKFIIEIYNNGCY